MFMNWCEAPLPGQLWSYLPLASTYLDFYNKHIMYTDINGFKGSEYAKTTNMIADYVNGISTKAKNYK